MAIRTTQQVGLLFTKWFYYVPHSEIESIKLSLGLFNIDIPLVPWIVLKMSIMSGLIIQRTC